MNYYNEFDPKAAAWLRELIAAGLIPDGIVDERSITEIKPHELSPYTQCHFFAGIGGWSLALQLAGWPADRPVWTGSCPCQSFSSAGQGKGTSDHRDIWPVFASLIRECRPATVFGEQVEAAIGYGWLDRVCADMEAEGYAVGAHVLGAHSAGAPHIRQRLYWVADSERKGLEGLAGYGDDRNQPGRVGEEPVGHAAESGSIMRWATTFGWKQVSFAADCIGGDDDEFGDECSICGLSYAEDCERPGPTQDGYEYEERGGVLFGRPADDGTNLRLGDAASGGCGIVRDAAQPGSCRHAIGANWARFEVVHCRDGKARRIPSEPALFPLAHGVPGRVGMLRGSGNAICPQTAQIFIEAFLGQ